MRELPDAERSSGEQARRLCQAYRFSLPEDRLQRLQRPLVGHFEACRQVLDIGCGRGVMLDLFREAGIECEGIDLLPEAVAHCRRKGHRAELADANDYLADKSECFDGIMCSHVVEHLEFEAAMDLFRLAFQALRPAGAFVVATPNVQAIDVMADVFWLDPTHRRPYPAMLVEAMMHDVGFGAVKTALPRGRPARRRQWPSWIFHKLWLGRYFGNPELIAVTRKPAA